MENVPQEVLNWLHSILLNGFRDVNRTYHDTKQALGRFPTIRPSTDVYKDNIKETDLAKAYDDGRSALLLHLAGTVPAKFRGVTYSFPVSVWIPQEYPAWPPIAFVTAAQGMAIRPGQHVGVEGKIYHPYLGSWQADRSNIPGFLQILSEIFSREPPLVAKQNAPPVPPVPRSNTRTSSLRTDLHITASPGQLQPPALPPKAADRLPPPEVTKSPPASTQDGPPPRPPKPGDHVPNPYTALGQQRTHSMTSPPPPQHTPRQGSISLGTGVGPSQQGQSWQQSQTPLSTPITAGSSQQYRPMPPIPQQQQQGHGPFPSGLQQQQQHTVQQNQTPAYQQQQPPLPQGPQVWQQQQHQQHQHYQQQQSHQAPQQVRKAPEPQDLLTSPFDLPLPSASELPVPPVPPNPEKDAILHAISASLTGQLHGLLQSNAAALPALQAQHAALAAAHGQLQQEFAHLRALEAQVQANEATLRASLDEADACIADARRRPAPDVDDTLIAPTVLSSQMYRLVAEEKSCVAARALLLRALDRGRLGADQWSKASRSIAREEWLKKWLLRRAARGMGLQDDGDDARATGYGEKEVAVASEDTSSFYR